MGSGASKKKKEEKEDTGAAAKKREPAADGGGEDTEPTRRESGSEADDETATLGELNAREKSAKTRDQKSAAKKKQYLQDREDRKEVNKEVYGSESGPAPADGLKPGRAVSRLDAQASSFGDRPVEPGQPAIRGDKVLHEDSTYDGEAGDPLGCVGSVLSKQVVIVRSPRRAPSL